MGISFSIRKYTASTRSASHDIISRFPAPQTESIFLSSCWKFTSPNLQNIDFSNALKNSPALAIRGSTLMFPYCFGGNLTFKPTIEADEAFRSKNQLQKGANTCGLQLAILEAQGQTI